MNCKFYPIESRIYDFFKFPTLLSERKRMEKNDDEDGVEVALYNNYRDFLAKVEEKIADFRKDIDFFYDLGELDFIDLISRPNQYFGYHSELEYLEFLSKLTSKEIYTSIAFTIISTNEGSHEYSPEIMAKATEISSNVNELISLIKDMPIEASAKWNLFLIAQEPVKYMNEFVTLMKKMHPLFERFYEPFIDEVNRYGNHLINYLSEKGAKGIEELSNNLIDSKVLANEETRLLITAMVPYSIALSGIGQSGYIAWGLHIEDALAYMKEQNENKVIERVNVFKNLGDKTRYEVVKLIAAGQSSTKEIATTLGVSSATISYHLNNLLQAKIIKLDRTDNKYGYVIDYPVLESVVNGLWDDLGKPSH